MATPIRKTGRVYSAQKYGSLGAINRALRSRKPNSIVPTPPGLPRSVPSRPNTGNPKFQ